MPVLMIALFALACFGVIGILLAAALAFEPKKSATPTIPPRERQRREEGKDATLPRRAGAPS